MTYDILLALISFALVTSVTPGPNNMMLLASGVNFGFRRTIPHMVGISVGHSFMVFLVGLGLAGIVHSWPPALLMLKVVSVLYMCWLAWKIANSGAPNGTAGAARPMTFWQAAAFQWVNPKAWAMALTATANYASSGSVAVVAVVAVVFSLVNLPSVSVWAWGGEALRDWLQNPKALRAFNWTMAALLIASLVPVLQM